MSFCSNFKFLYVVTVRLMFPVNILKVGLTKNILSSFGLVQNVSISSNCLSRVSTVEKFECTLKSLINFNSADSSSSTLALSKKTQNSSNFVEQF